MIIGGTGFLGRQFTERLVSKYDVVVACRYPNATASQLPEAVATVEADVTDSDRLSSVVEEVGPDTIVNLAGVSNVSRAAKNPALAAEVNLLGAQNALRAARRSGCDVFVGISSVAAQPPATSTYGITKAAMERMLVAQNEPGQCFSIPLRIGRVPWSPGSVLAVWYDQILSTGRFVVMDPAAMRLFNPIDSVVALTEMVIASAEECAGSIVVAPMKSTEVARLADTMARLTRSEWSAGEALGGEASPSERPVSEFEASSTVARHDNDGRDYHLIRLPLGESKAPADCPSSPPATATDLEDWVRGGLSHE